MTPPLQSSCPRQGEGQIRDSMRRDGQREVFGFRVAEGTCAFGTAVPSLRGWNHNSGGAG